MSTNNEEEDMESRLRRYRSFGMTQLVNMTRGKMEADLRAYYDRVEAAAANPNVHTKEGWKPFKEACLALLDRLKAWQAEFKKFQLGEDQVDAECVNTANKALSDIREEINEVVDIHNEAAQRRIDEIHEQERRDIQASRNDLAAYTLDWQKRMNKKNSEFADKLRAIRKRLR